MSEIHRTFIPESRVQLSDAEAKQFATLPAESTLCGHALSLGRNGKTRAPFFASRWGWIHPIYSLEEARQLLDQIRGCR